MPGNETEKTNLFEITDGSSIGLFQEPHFTGRYIVLLDEGRQSAGQKTLRAAAGIKHMASAADFMASEVSVEALEGADGLVLPEIGAVVVDGDPEQVAAVAMLSDHEKGITNKEPEQICYALQTADHQRFAVSPDYARGYRDAVNAFTDLLLVGPQPLGDYAIEVWIETQVAWGLQAILADRSSFSGKGARVAVLDTGMDMQHPDFSSRQIEQKSFVPGQAVQDGNGHGTHCIGTACGPQSPGQLPRYGLAYEADIFAVKVLSNQGSGADGGILAGINWAVANKCHVVSMSLGARVRQGDAHSPVYEGVARRVLDGGGLIIAAAGNDSGKPVSRPANCPSILAVSALDRNLQLASFSNVGINPNGGQIDIAAPGVEILSSVPMPRKYAKFDGTSMATPHVAGIAALYHQAGGFTGNALWRELVTTARRLPLPSAHVGAGIVQAPQ